MVGKIKSRPLLFSISIVFFDIIDEIIYKWGSFENLNSFENLFWNSIFSNDLNKPYIIIIIIMLLTIYLIFTYFLLNKLHTYIIKV